MACENTREPAPAHLSKSCCQALSEPCVSTRCSKCGTARKVWAPTSTLMGPLCWRGALQEPCCVREVQGAQVAAGWQGGHPWAGTGRPLQLGQKYIMLLAARGSLLNVSALYMPVHICSILPSLFSAPCMEQIFYLVAFEHRCSPIFSPVFPGQRARVHFPVFAKGWPWAWVLDKGMWAEMMCQSTG